MPMPKINYNPMSLGKKEHKEYIAAVKEAMKDLDFALRCYYISLSDNSSLSEKEKLDFMKYAYEEALKDVGIHKEMKVMIHGTAC